MFKVFTAAVVTRVYIAPEGTRCVNAERQPIKELDKCNFSKYWQGSNVCMRLNSNLFMVMFMIKC